MMHSGSLRILYLDDPDYVSDVGKDNQMFREMCLDCVSSSSWPSPWIILMVAAGRQKSIQTLTWLRILRLFTEHRHLGDGPRLSRRAQKLANTMFNTLYGYCPSLKAIVIDLRSEHRGCDDCGAAIHSDTFCYLRELRIDILGKTTATACAVSMKDMKRYISPCEILYDDHEPRVRELL
ncbi:hypothetical protein EJ03DRAFT_142893 [Teratosphaeria nubilosa]|uniref:Uncharacterized protein n=1 Tax=Teratosphaeria nubilosa TaxID=161662 RepID=A0A6G1L5A6_9PEZI|nr:hypothetical protein EJ03DRAFT_142893 [Teratosphaeria nubilosa]